MLRMVFLLIAILSRSGNAPLFWTADRTNLMPTRNCDFQLQAAAWGGLSVLTHMISYTIKLQILMRVTN